MKKLVVLLSFVLITVSVYSQVNRKRQTQKVTDHLANKTVIFRNAWKTNKAIYAKTNRDGKIGNYKGELSEKFVLIPTGMGSYYIQSKKYPESYIALSGYKENSGVDLGPFDRSTRSMWKLVRGYGNTYKIKNAMWGTVIDMSKSKGHFNMYPDLGNSSKFVSGAKNQKWTIVIL